MIRPMSGAPAPAVAVWTHAGPAVGPAAEALAPFVMAGRPAPLGRHPRWLGVLRDGLGHEVFALEARAAGRTCGFLPLAHVESLLFGRFLVSLPYLNSNGVGAGSPDVEAALVSRAVELADELGVRHLELRHERAVDHPALGAGLGTKVHMRLPLPGTPDALWKGLDTKVRNQVRKGEKSGLRVQWGGPDLLDPFHAVLSENMRDLGSPVYGRGLFAAALAAFPGAAEVGVVWAGKEPAAAALLLHGPGTTEVPTASALRSFNSQCANMLLYRHLLDRAVARGQAVFDFGRSTLDGPTFRFKKQWGAVPHPAVWQHYVRHGEATEMRPDNPRYRGAIRVWQRLPVGVTKRLGPAIVRGIP